MMMQRNLRDNHLWLSIFTRPPYSTFTRRQRVTCALSFILIAMLTNIMFYGVPTDDPDAQFEVTSIRFSWTQVLCDMVLGSPGLSKFCGFSWVSSRIFQIIYFAFK